MDCVKVWSRWLLKILTARWELRRSKPAHPASVFPPPLQLFHPPAHPHKIGAQTDINPSVFLKFCYQSVWNLIHGHWLKWFVLRNYMKCSFWCSQQQSWALTMKLGTMLILSAAWVCAADTVMQLFKLQCSMFSIHFVVTGFFIACTVTFIVSCLFEIRDALSISK